MKSTVAPHQSGHDREQRRENPGRPTEVCFAKRAEPHGKQPKPENPGHRDGCQRRLLVQQQKPIEEISGSVGRGVDYPMEVGMALGTVCTREKKHRQRGESCRGDGQTDARLPQPEV